MHPEKRVLALFLAILMALTMSTPAFAQENAPKDEVVYVNLNHDGSVDNIYVVNAFDLSAETAVTDYGTYSDVRNLTTTQPLTDSDGKVSFSAPAGKFYYQGNLESRDIPWKVGVSYQLDGKEVTGEELAGASGHLRITLHLAQNPTANPVYRDNFALQATAMLDGDRCKNISAPDATIANVGNNKQLSYIVLPGKEKTYTIEADVTDFTMDGISINGIPLSLDIDDPDTSELKDKIGDLQDGAVELDDGAGKLDDGVSTLRDGVTTLRDGAQDLKDGASDLYDGVKKLRKGVDALDSGGVAAMKGAGELKAGFDTLMSRSRELKMGLAASQEQMIAALHANGFDLPLPPVPEDPLNTLYLVQVGMTVDKGLDTAIAQLKHLIGQLEEGVGGYRDSGQVYDSGFSPALGGADQLERIKSTLVLLMQYQQVNALGTGTLTYIAGTEQLSAGYEVLYKGLQDLTGGINELFFKTGDLKDGARDLYDGTDDLVDGVNDLYDGALQLKDGTNELTDGTFELRDKTRDMDSQVDDEVNDMLDEYRTKDFQMVSFVDGRNTDVHSVQFVMKVAEIEKPEVAQAVQTDGKPGFWQRVTNLFSFLKK